MQKKWFIWLLLLLIFNLSLQAIQAQDEKIRVAVLDLEVAGIDSTVIIGLSNRLRAELIQTRQFDVMERNRMEALLFEQGFQQTGACTSDECLVEAGKILGVANMIAGSVGKVGRLYAVSIRMIDVNTGRILFSITEDTPGPIENVLTTAMPNMAKKFAARAVAPSESLEGFGSLRLNSNPTGARIFIDNRSMRGKTPFTIDSLTAGVHVIRLQKGVLTASKAIFIAPDEATNINLELTELKGALKVVTAPDGADIFLDYEYKGRSPNTLLDLSVGSYHLKLTKAGFVPYMQIVAITENETRLISAQMRQMAQLTLHTNPLDCQVFIDDSLYGRTPLTLIQLKPGFHQIRVRKKNFVSYEEIHSLPAGINTELEINLMPAATLHITSEPVEAELFINDISQGRTPVSVADVKPGLVKLKLKHPLYEDYLTQIALNSGEKRHLEFTMIRKTGQLTVASIPFGAKVEIDGEISGKTPLELKGLTYGKHLVRIINEGYRTYEAEIEIQSPLPQMIKTNLSIARGTLFLYPQPNDAFVQLNGRKLTEIPTGGLKLFPGEYQLSARRPGYENWLNSVQITPNQAAAVRIHLQPKSTEKAILRSCVLPGLGQYYGEKYTRFYLFTITEALSLTGIIISDVVYDAKIKNYTEKRTSYLQAVGDAEIQQLRSEMVDLHQGIESAKNWRRNFLIAAIGTWMLNVLDAAIFPPIRPLKADIHRESQSRPQQFYLTQSNQNIQLGIQWKL